MEVDIHQPDPVSFVCEGDGKVGGDAAFPHSPFSTHDQDFVLDMSKTLFNLLILHGVLILLVFVHWKMIDLSHTAITLQS
jgi:hypothetical protein